LRLQNDRKAKGRLETNGFSQLYKGFDLYDLPHYGQIYLWLFTRHRKGHLAGDHEASARRSEIKPAALR